jgi:hypothetical protein
MAARRVLAARDMPAERRRATALDRTHHLQLLEAHMPAVGLAPGRAVIAENVRDLQWSSHGRRRYGTGGSGSLLSCLVRLRRGALKPSSGLSILAIIPIATRPQAGSWHRTLSVTEGCRWLGSDRGSMPTGSGLLVNFAHF